MNRWKYVLVGLLVGAFAFPLVWVSDPLVIGQTVTVDSTQSPLVVNALADLADLTPTDGQSVIIKTGTEKGLWYYDKDSATATSVSVLNGPGSVGRFLVINNDAGSVAAATAITAAEIADDGLLELQAFDGSAAKSLTLEELKKTGVQVINVVQEGADPTGVASSTAAFTAAVASAISSGRTLWLPNGTYDLSSATDAITVNGDLTIIGESKAGVIIQGAAAENFLSVSAGSNVWLENFRCEDFSSAVFMSTSTSIAPHGNLTVRGVDVDSCDYAITDNGSAAYLGNVEISGCTFSTLTAAGIQLRYTSADSINIDGNEIGAISGSADVFGVLLGTLSASTTSGSVNVTRNYVHDLYTSSAAEDCLGIFVESTSANITNNRLKNVYAAPGNQDHEGIYVKSDHSVITGNRLQDAGGTEGCITAKGDRRDGSVAGNPDGFNVTIANNHVVFTNDLVVQAYTLTSCDAGTDVFTITGNALANYYAVKFSNSGGALPTGLTAGVVYWVINESGDTFKVSTTQNGSAVDISDTGSGTTTVSMIHTPSPNGNGIHSIMEATIVANNTLDRCGISLNEADYSVATGNVLYGNIGTCISVYEASAVSVVNNVVYDWSPKYSAAYCFLVRANNDAMKGVNVSGNHIYNTATSSVSSTRIAFGVLEIGSGSLADVTIENNHVVTGMTHFYLETGSVSNTWVRENKMNGVTTIINGSVYPTDFTRNTFDGADAGIRNQGNKTGSVAALWKLYHTETMTLTGSIDLSAGFTAPSTPRMLRLVLTQNGTGGYTVTWPSIMWKAGELQPDATASAISVFDLYFDGTNYHEVSVNNSTDLQLIEASTAGSGAPNVLLGTESAKVLTNEGTTAANYHTLPTAVAGLTYTFVVQDADGLRITAASGDTIRLGPNVTATAGYIESTTIGDVVTATAINATEWVGHAYGTWTNGTWSYAVADTP